MYFFLFCAKYKYPNKQVMIIPAKQVDVPGKQVDVPSKQVNVPAKQVMIIPAEPVMIIPAEQVVEVADLASTPVSNPASSVNTSNVATNSQRLICPVCRENYANAATLQRYQQDVHGKTFDSFYLTTINMAI